MPSQDRSPSPPWTPARRSDPRRRHTATPSTQWRRGAAPPNGLHECVRDQPVVANANGITHGKAAMSVMAFGGPDIDVAAGRMSGAAAPLASCNALLSSTRWRRAHRCYPGGPPLVRRTNADARPLLRPASKTGSLEQNRTPITRLGPLAGVRRKRHREGLTALRYDLQPKAGRIGYGGAARSSFRLSPPLRIALSTPKQMQCWWQMRKPPKRDMPRCKQGLLHHGPMIGWAPTKRTSTCAISAWYSRAPLGGLRQRCLASSLVPDKH